MDVENGDWRMRGLDRNDPGCIRSWQELVSYVDEVGFLPLFSNDTPGFSAEERMCPQDWWTGDPDRDPWEWREIIARSGKVAYGKFFDQRAGFVSLAWFPDFVNCRRDGYDFDARWDDELADIRHKKIMNQFDRKDEWISLDLKRQAGFGKGGEKNYAGMITALQMQTYLVIKDFRRKINKRGDPYGMPVCVYARPETLWSYDWVTSAYRESPARSAERISRHLAALWPQMTEKERSKLLR